jgi:hypothetical protein
VTTRGALFPLTLLAALATCPLRADAQVPASVQPGPAPVTSAAAIASPEQFFGFRMGEDGRLAGWSEIERYFTDVAAASDRVDLVRVGTTTERQAMIAAVVSAPENLARLQDIRQASLRLADPRRLGEEEARALLRDQKAIVAIGCSIHASEIGATQMASELLHTLATTQDEQWLGVLRETVVLLIPSLNPDGHRLVMDWYDRTKGTAFEGAPMPWLYHRYAGHDINRDAFMMQLAENRSLARFFYREWHPQVFLSLHQMGPRGPRFFVPPNYDPIDPNHDPMIWRTAGLLGGAMSFALEREGRDGVVSSALYDYFWPGYEDSAPLGHNIVCLLTEAASVKLAWPLEVAAGDLVGSPRGLPEYRPQVNFPNPWPGGSWRLRDIVDYELIAVGGLLDAVARYRAQVVENGYAMARRAVERGRAGEPFAFVFSPEQHDPHAAARLQSLLLDGAVDLHRAMEPFTIGTRSYPAGTVMVLMGQPYRAYAKTLLERQHYPVRRLVRDGPPERPYDVTGWTLPLQLGVGVEQVDAPFELPVMTTVDKVEIPPGQIWGERRPSYYLVDVRGTGGALAINRLLAAGTPLSWTLAPAEAQGYRYPAGTLVVRHTRATRTLLAELTRSLGLPAIGLKGRPRANVASIGGARIALHKPWVESPDEGWTRYLLEQYGFRFANVSDQDVRRGSLGASWDAIVLADVPADRLVKGHEPGSVPEAYAGGLGREGLEALQVFAAEGGTLVCLDSSCQALIDNWSLPVGDGLRGLPPEKFYGPGSLVEVALDATHPLSFGMPTSVSGMFVNGSAYQTRPGAPPEVDSRAGTPVFPARYGEGNPLQSGWLEGPELLAGQPAVAELPYGRGRIVLIGFRAQHRAQSLGTFRLLFNALYTARRLK